MWKISPGSSTYYTTFNNMPAENINCYISQNNGTQFVNYYIETFTPGQYELKQSVGGLSYTRLSVEDKQPIDGFSFKEWREIPDSFKGQGINDSNKTYTNSSWLKYTRNSYAIHFNNCSNVSDASVKFEQPIGQFIPVSATAPDTVDDDYVFDGWYTAPEGGEKVDSSTSMTMPSHVLQLYARWKKPEFRVNYETNNDDFTADSVELPKGDEITLPDTSNWTGFVGWYTDPGFAHPFVEGSQIGEDTTLYAKWEKDNQSTYKIRYEDAQGNLLKVVVSDEAVEVGSSKIVTAETEIVVGGKTYYPTETTQTISISQNADDNVAVFTCKPVVDWSYTVKYVDDDNKVLVEEELTTTDTVVQARAKSIEGYQLKEGEDIVKTLNSGADVKEIVFHYTKNETSYTVQFLEEGTDKELAKEQVVRGVKVGAYVTANPVTVEDYEPVTTGNDLGAAVKANGATVIKVYYRHCAHTVRYELDPAFIELYAGTLPEEQTLRTSEEGTVADGLTLDGYTFTGWTTEDTTVTNGKFTMPAGDVTFVGSFKRDLSAVRVDKIDETYSGNTYKLTVSGTKDGDEVKFYNEKGEEISNEFKNVGDSQNVKVVITNGSESKELTTTVNIAPVQITLTSGSGTWTYDGKEHSKPEVTVTGEFVKGEGLTYTDFATIKDAGEKENKFTYSFLEGVKAENYAITPVFGQLTVEKAQAQITVKDGEAVLSAEGIHRVYDGTTSQISASTTADDDTRTTYTFLIDGEEVSGDDLKFKDVVDTKVTVRAEHPNYTFKEVSVPVVITPKDVKISSATLSKTYDGTPLTNGDKSLIAEGFVSEEGIENVVFDASITNAGETFNTYSYTLKDNTKASNYNIEDKPGTLTVAKRHVSLQSASASKPYDGTPLTAPEVYELDNSEGFVDGEGCSYQFSNEATITNIGSKQNVFDVQLNQGTNAENYDIERHFGSLEITDAKGAITVDPGTTATIDGESIKKVYDGAAVELTVTTVNEKNVPIATGYTYVVNGVETEELPEMKNVGKWEITFKPTDPNLKDLSKTVTVEVTPRPYTVVTGGGSKEYDGTPLTNSEITIGNIVDGETVTGITNGSITEVGDTRNTYELTFGEGALASNYTLGDETIGTLIITKAKPDITIEIDGSKIGAEGFKREYDGTTSTITASAKNSNGAAIDGQFTYSVDGGKATTEVPTFTNSGKWSVEVTTGNQNCEEASVTVTVEITKRKIHLKSIDAEKVYDGKAITDHDKVNVVSGKFVEGEEPVFHTFGTYVDAGEYDNEFSMKFNARPSASLLSRVARYLNPSEDPDHIADNYEITHEYGKVKIKKAASDLHNLDIGDKTVTYNGKEQSLDAATSDIESATIQYSADGGKTWTDTMPAFVDAGKYEVTARAVHGNYEDAEKTAVLTVLPAELVVETESATKEYDGKPLTAGGKLIGVVDGDVIAIKMTGSQTEVGKSPNTYELDFGSTKASNYTITEKLGVLEVIKAAEKPASKPKQDVPTALGLDPNLWTSIMGVSGAAMIMTVKLSRKEKNKKNKK